MRFIKPTAELAVQQPGVIGMLKFCEMVGRVCTHSEDKITDDSYKRFLKDQIKHGHMSPLEAGTVYLVLPINKENELIEFFKDNTYSYVFEAPDLDRSFITTNYRVIIENDLSYLLDDYWSEPTDLHLPRICIKSETCIEVYKDLTRHRSHSPMVESTRFCNYAKDKFSHNVGFTLPCWLGYKSGKPEEEEKWLTHCLETIEMFYFQAQELYGWDAQRASYLLPQGTKATVFLTAFLPDWEHFMDLRYKEVTGPVRPDVKELTTLFYELLKDYLE